VLLDAAGFVFALSMRKDRVCKAYGTPKQKLNIKIRATTSMLPAPSSLMRIRTVTVVLLVGCLEVRWYVRLLVVRLHWCHTF
jgi:hypothetical protein